MPLRTADPELRRLIDQIASYRSLPSFSYRGQLFTAAMLLEGMVITESSGDPLATRYEPHQDKADRLDATSDQDRSLVDDGPIEDDKSYGLLQIMGYNIKMMTGVFVITSTGKKFPDPKRIINFNPFFDPEVNLILGTRLFKAELLAVARDIQRSNREPLAGEMVSRALMRYNGGPTGDKVLDDGIRRLQAYVDKVAKNCILAKLSRQGTL